MSEAKSGSNGRATEYLTAGIPHVATLMRAAGYWLQYFAADARNSPAGR